MNCSTQHFAFPLVAPARSPPAAPSRWLLRRRSASTSSTKPGRRPASPNQGAPPSRVVLFRIPSIGLCASASDAAAFASFFSGWRCTGTTTTTGRRTCGSTARALGNCFCSAAPTTRNCGLGSGTSLAAATFPSATPRSYPRSELSDFTIVLLS